MGGNQKNFHFADYFVQVTLVQPRELRVTALDILQRQVFFLSENGAFQHFFNNLPPAPITAIVRQNDRLVLTLQDQFELIRQDVQEVELLRLEVAFRDFQFENRLRDAQQQQQQQLQQQEQRLQLQLANIQAQFNNAQQQLRNQRPILTDSGRVNRDYHADSPVGGNPLSAGQNQTRGVNRVNFTQPFTTAPSVHVGIVGIDLYCGANQRLKVFAQNITAQGFDLMFYTWADTLVWAVEASWLAIGK